MLLKLLNSVRNVPYSKELKHALYDIEKTAKNLNNEILESLQYAAEELTPINKRLGNLRINLAKLPSLDEKMTTFVDDTKNEFDKIRVHSENIANIFFNTNNHLVEYDIKLLKTKQMVTEFSFLLPEQIAKINNSSPLKLHEQLIIGAAEEEVAPIIFATVIGGPPSWIIGGGLLVIENIAL